VVVKGKGVHESTEGVVYMMKSSAPGMETLGTPREEVHKDEKVLLQRLCNIVYHVTLI